MLAYGVFQISTDPQIMTKGSQTSMMKVEVEHFIMLQLNTSVMTNQCILKRDTEPTS